MNKHLLAGLTIGLFITGIAGITHATLIGDTVTVQHYHQNNPTTWSNLDSVVVADGPSDTMALAYNHYNYDVNIDDSIIFVDFANVGQWLAPTFNGLIVDSLDDSTGNALQGVTIDTNLRGWGLARLSVNDDRVSFNWQNLKFTSDSYFNASLDFGSAEPVPEPATMLLFGVGLACLAGGRLKYKNNNR